MDTKKLIIKRNFTAKKEIVWEGFTLENVLKQWWAPSDMECSHASVELKNGGMFLYCFKSLDMKEYWGRGIYQTIERPELLRYLDSFADKDGNAVAPNHYGIPGDEIAEALIAFKFEDAEHGTSMVATMDNSYDAAMTSEMVKGWNQMFDRLENYFKLRREPIIVEQIFKSPVEKVWAAITQVDLMKKWYFNTIESFEPTVGFSINFEVLANDKKYIHLWDIAEVEEYKKLSYFWKYEGVRGNSKLTWELTPEGVNTKLKITHSGLDTFTQDNPDFTRESGLNGWKYFICESLKNFLEN